MQAVFFAAKNLVDSQTSKDAKIIYAQASVIFSLEKKNRLGYNALHNVAGILAKEERTNTTWQKEFALGSFLMAKIDH